MKTSFIPIDYDYFDFNGRNYTKIIGRNSEGKRVCIIDSCPVYLWAILKNNLSQKEIGDVIKKISKIKLNIKGRQTKVEKVELHNKKFLEKPVKALKIFATNYKDLHDIADKLGIKEIEKRRGYDLGFITHYIIEKKINPLQKYEIEGEMLNNSSEFGGVDMGLDVDLCINLKKAKLLENKKTKFFPKILAYDIETDDLKIGKGEILMVSLVSEKFKKVITWKKSYSKPSYVEYVKDETELIEKFIEYVKKISPDFLVGYFSDGFDLPYLKARAEKHKIKLNLGLDNSQPRFSRGINLTGKIKGIVHIDILKFIKTAYAQYMKSETLSLNEVAKEFLGDTKKPFKIKHSSELEKKDWNNYYEYNLHDSVLTLNLFQKFWPDIKEFTKIVKEPVFDITRYGLSKIVESYLLHNLEKFNEIPEKRPTSEELSQRRRDGPVEGAFVFEPKPGLYENIAMFDFTSMHTSIIISMNISKSTLLEKPEKNTNSIETKRGKFYFTKKPGFLPSLLKEIFEQRRKAKSEFKKNPNPITQAGSNAFKVLSASVHGYIGFFGARYYSKEASASILAFVRKFNKDTIKNIEKKGYKVIYGDTDSIAFLINKNKEIEIKSLLQDLNDKLPGIMELELEGFFERGLWVTTRAGITGAKKKYALLSKDKKIKIRGFETVRRDWCNLARKLQDQIIKQILIDGNEKKSLEYLKDIVKKIKQRKIRKEELIIKTQLKKPISEYKATTPHVVAAKKMHEKKIPIGTGTLIKYYVAEANQKKALVRERVKLPDEPGKYDIKYYLERQILPAVENIFQVFKINTKEIIEGKKQMTLGDF
ncbi:MAG: DNA-directed DNA polymerase [Nanoarchaeota archaeon]|nr:DNA-directed DNA polymerase [Nanoarchaeota archaeon]MBU1027544.1 DNA-directed DNA polymerase [Nanoarchaeota archaeon]